MSLYLPAKHVVHAPPLFPVYPALHSQSVTLSLPAVDVESDDGQSKQSAGPTISLYLPATHAVHSPPSGPVYPAMHSQSVTLSLPAADVASDDGQSKHSALPAVSLYLPAGHAVHWSPSLPVYPASHTQSVTLPLAAGDVEFDGQLEHSALPAVSLYVPAGHAVHSPPSGPVYPVLQVQSVTLSLATGEVAHAGQAEQLPVPAAALYLPSGHAVHLPPSAPPV